MHSVYFTRLVQDSVASQGILVEYNGGSGTTTVRFTDMVKARRFYLKQVEAGNNPSIVRESEQVATPSPADLKAQLNAKKAERAGKGATPAPPLKAGDIRTVSGKATPPAVKTPTTTTQESKSADLPKIKPGKAPLKAPSKPVDAPKASEAPKVAPKAPVAPEGKSGPLKAKVAKEAVKSPSPAPTTTTATNPDPVKRGRGRPRKDAGKPNESAKAPSPVPAGDKPARLIKGAKAGKTPKEGKEPKEVKTPARKGVGETGESGIVRFKDLPWNEKKVALFKALKELKATSPARAVSAKVVMDHNPDLSGRDVRHYSYHAKAAGLIEIEKVEKVPGYSFYLTEAGVAINPDKELAKQRSKGSKAVKAESQNAGDAEE
jgi:hypothetical protein